MLPGRGAGRAGGESRHRPRQCRSDGPCGCRIHRRQPPAAPAPPTRAARRPSPCSKPSSSRTTRSPGCAPGSSYSGPGHTTTPGSTRCCTRAPSTSARTCASKKRSGARPRPRSNEAWTPAAPPRTTPPQWPALDLRAAVHGAVSMRVNQPGQNWPPAGGPRRSLPSQARGHITGPSSRNNNCRVVACPGLRDSSFESPELIRSPCLHARTSRRSPDRVASSEPMPTMIGTPTASLYDVRGGELGLTWPGAVYGAVMRSR